MTNTISNYFQSLTKENDAIKGFAESNLGKQDSTKCHIARGGFALEILAIQMGGAAHAATPSFEGTRQDLDREALTFLRDNRRALAYALDMTLPR